MCHLPDPWTRALSKTAALNRLGSLKRRWSVVLTVLLAALTLGAGLLISHTTSRGALDGIADRISTYRETASAVRLAGIAALTIAWPKIVRRFVPATNPRFDRLQALRWRVTGWLFTLEIVLGQNLLGRLME